MNPNQFALSPEEIICWQKYHMLMLQQRIFEANEEIGKLRHEINELRNSMMLQAQEQENGKSENKRQYWTEEEHAKFLEALQIYGPKGFNKIAEKLGTRSPAQIRSHMQKHFLKLKKQARCAARGAARTKKAKPKGSTSSSVAAGTPSFSSSSSSSSFLAQPPTQRPESSTVPSIRPSTPHGPIFDILAQTHGLPEEFFFPE